MATQSELRPTGQRPRQERPSPPQGVLTASPHSQHVAPQQARPGPKVIPSTPHSLRETRLDHPLGPLPSSSSRPVPSSCYA